MHKGLSYELWQEYRTWCGEYPYPLWSPAAWQVTTATWAGTAAASAPGPPFDLTPTGVTPGLAARYEHVLWDNGGGDHAILGFEAYLSTPDHCRMRITGDWGIHGSLPDDFHHNFDFPWAPFSSFILSSSTPAESFLRPVHLEWAAKPY